jgi:hypothetical protein
MKIKTFQIEAFGEDNVDAQARAMAQFNEENPCADGVQGVFWIGRDAATGRRVCRITYAKLVLENA